MGRQAWVGLAVLVAALVAAVAAPARRGAQAAMQPVVALVRIEGTITTGGEDLLLPGAGGARSDRLMDLLEKARRDPAVQAVVLRVNTPGGSPAAAFEISEEIRYLKAAGKKVVVSMGDLATSAGYYIAAQADHILAAPSTWTGNIGVILTLANVEELYRKLGLRPTVLKSGPYKDMGSPLRDMTDEERRIFNELITRSYDEFVRVVAEGRQMPVDQVRRLADGRVYSGQQAVDLGLVDGLGSLKDAVRKAAELAGLKEGQYQVKELGRVSPLEAFLRLPGALVQLAQWLQAGPAEWIQRAPAEGLPPVR